MEEKKKDYKREYLEDFIGLTGIADLTLQDVYGALVLLVRHGELAQKSKSLWSRYQFNHLYRRLLDADDFSNPTMTAFKKAVEQTRYDRKHRSDSIKKEVETPVDDEEPESFSPEEDMNTVSQELLKKDDVFYENFFSNVDTADELFENFLV